MGTTVIFATPEDRSKRLRQAQTAEHLAAAEAEVERMEELIIRVVKDLSNGAEVKIVACDGSEIIARRA